VTDELEIVVDRVAASRRYRNVDAGLLRRLAGEELTRARTREEAVKRVKRRLHQAVGAFARGTPRLDTLRDAWDGSLADPAFRAACVAVMRSHASTAERVPFLASFYRSIWELTGTPATLLDLGCGLGPLALPWMELPRGTPILGVDVDGSVLATVDAFLSLVGQPHRTEECDLLTVPSVEPADAALLLKLVTTLDRQDPEAATRLVASLRVRHAVVSFTRRSLSGRSRGMERTYRERLDRLAREVGARDVREASVANELVFVLTLSNG
jgi:16S rRNA (guanine(1405)-N(7))-methyltransferase